MHAGKAMSPRELINWPTRTLPRASCLTERLKDQIRTDQSRENGRIWTPNCRWKIKIMSQLLYRVSVTQVTQFGCWRKKSDENSCYCSNTNCVQLINDCFRVSSHSQYVYTSLFTQWSISLF